MSYCGPKAIFAQKKDARPPTKRPSVTVDGPRQEVKPQADVIQWDSLLGNPPARHGHGRRSNGSPPAFTASLPRAYASVAFPVDTLGGDFSTLYQYSYDTKKARRGSRPRRAFHMSVPPASRHYLFSPVAEVRGQTRCGRPTCTSQPHMWLSVGRRPVIAREAVLENAQCVYQSACGFCLSS